MFRAHLSSGTARFLSWFLALAFGSALVLRAEPRLHRDILVFIPAYEGSKLYDSRLGDKEDDPPCVWGTLGALRSSELYLALRMPNPLEAKPMLSAGPLDVYQGFVDAMTDDRDGVPKFRPYTLNADFFIFAYDWRQDMGTVTAPELGRALQDYARIHEARTGVSAKDVRFVIVAHSMGGLVARTLLSENPALADHVSRLYLVGTPNLGSVKAIKTLIVGPGGLKENMTSFPVSLLNVLPSNVDANLTKLVAITRPSIYELLPFEDPRWECVNANGARTRVSAEDLLSVGPWENYWPSAELEKKVFLKTWLKKRQEEGRLQIDPPAWEFCQDPDYRQLQKILAQVKDWRIHLGSLSYTSTLLTRAGESTRLRVVVGTGLKTPTGIITEGAHDASQARYTYAPDNDGDETVTGTSVLDDFHGTAEDVKLLSGVPHGKLMLNKDFLTYFCRELAQSPVLKEEAESTPASPGPLTGQTVP